MFLLFAYRSYALLPPISKEYTPLYNDVLAKSRQLQQNFQPIPIMKPGNYELPGIKFKLTKTVVAENTGSLRSMSFTNDHKSVLVFQTEDFDFSSNHEYIIADKATNSFRSISAPVARTGQVYMYQLDKIDPLSFIHNLEISTAPNGSYDCTFDTENYDSAICQAWISAYWPTASQGQNPLEFDPIPQKLLNGRLTAQFGAYAQILGSFNLKITGLSDISLDYILEASGVYGLGVEFDASVHSNNISLGEQCIDIYRIGYTIFGISLTVTFRGCVDMSLNDLSLSTPSTIKYYSRRSVSVQKKGHISPSGASSEPFTYTNQPSTTDNIFSKDSFKPDLSVSLIGTPEVKLYGQITFNIFSEVQGKVDVGLDIETKWQFDFNKAVCLSPYLYGSSDIVLSGFISCTPIHIKSLDYTMLSGFSERIPLYAPPQYKFCLFSAFNSQEGLDALINPTDYSSLIIRPRTARHVSDSSARFSVRLDVLDNNNVIKTLQLQDLSFKGNENINLSRIMVLKDVPNTAYIKFNGIKVNTIFDDKLTFEGQIYLNQESQQEICGMKGNDESTKICIDTEVSRSYHVDVSKEFSGEDFSYVSLELPIDSPNNEYSLITHSSTQGYEVTESEIFDDTAIDTKNMHTTYKTGRNLELTLNSVFFSCGLTDSPYTISLWYYSCPSTDTPVDQCIAVGEMYSETAYRNKDNTPETLKLVEKSLPFKLDEGSILKVRLSVNTFITTQKEWIINNIEGTHNEELEGGSYKLSLSFTKRSATVLFNAKNLKSDVKGIVSRVFPLDSTYEMYEDEQYGLISLPETSTYTSTFTSSSASYSDSSYFITSIPEDTVTVLHNGATKLDDHTFMLKVPSTRLISFRRSSTDKRSLKFGSLDFFVNDDDPYCHISSPSYSPHFGCVSQSSNSKYEVISNYHFTSMNTTQTKSTKSKSTQTWTLNKFTSSDCPYGEKITFANTFIDMCQQATFVVPSHTTSSLSSTPGAKLEVNCSPNCVHARFETNGNTTTGFTVESIQNTTYTITSICLNINSNYCEYYDPLGDNNTYYHITGSAQIDDGPLGLTNHIARGNSKILKLSEVEIKPLKSGPLSFKKRVDPSMRTHTIISAFLGKQHVPISQTFSTDPSKVLKSLGCTSPEGGYSAGDASMLSDGSVRVRTSLITGDPSSDALDFPDSYIRPSNTTAIALGITIPLLVVIAIVCGLSFWYIKRRRNNEIETEREIRSALLV